MTDSPPAVAPRPPRHRRLWWALVASLTVNIFLVGWVASTWVYGPRFGPGIGPRPSPSAGMPFRHHRAMHAVSGADREAAERIWRENLPELRKRLRALRAAHEDLRRTFVADAADEKAMTSAVAALKDKANGVFDLANSALLKIAATLPPAARKAYFEAGFRRPRFRDRDDDRPPDRDPR
ncbi:MAG: periplasmic heavy metal sensor [Rhodospirillaceae bacterium]|nr:periplasmic heavy metal sensor [Rhodospirillaceae bacterium]